MGYVQSNFLAAQKAGRDAVALALNQGDINQYFRLSFHLGSAYGCHASYGSALAVFRQGAESAERNGHHLWVALFQLEVALCHVCLLSFDEGLRLAQPAEAFGESLGVLGKIVSLVKAAALLGLGQAGESLRMLSGAELVDGTHLDLRFLRQYLLADALLAQKEYANALDEAQILIERSSAPPLRGFVAYGHRQQALAWLALGNDQRATESLQLALQWLHAGEPSMMSRPILTDAKRIFEDLGQLSLAERCRKALQIEHRRIADNLSAHGFPELHQRFCAHPQILHAEQPVPVPHSRPAMSARLS